MVEKLSNTTSEQYLGQERTIGNPTAKTVGIEIVVENGTRIRFNLPVGQSAKFLADGADLKIYLKDAFEDLVGIDER